MRKLLPTSRAGRLSAVALTALVAAPLPALAASYTGSAAAVHMELKNSSGGIVCSAYNTSATSAPVATGCPTGVFTEQLFNANWGRIGSDRSVTVGNPTASYTGSAAAVHMELKNSLGGIVCSAYNTSATSPPVAASCPYGTWTEQLFNISWGRIGSDRTVTVGSTSTAGELRNTQPKFRVYENTASSSLVVNNLTDAVTTFDDGSAAIPGQAGDGNFRVSCQFSHFSYDDPIINPGQPGQAHHLHMFFGNTKTNANTTKNSLVNTGGGSCNGFELNRSAYWTPTLLNASGQAVVPETILIYYKSKFPANTQRMPQGLELIAGNTTSSSFNLTTSKHLFWSCGANGSITNESSTIPSCGTKPINASIYFPQCWDGVNLKYDKNRPHMFQLKHVTDTCPAAFPVLLPQLGILIYWPAQSSTAGWTLSSDAPGTTTRGGTLHADWIGGWHDATMDRWMNNCIKTKRNCTMGQTGTNRTLRRLNGGQPDSWPGPYFMTPPPRPAQ